MKRFILIALVLMIYFCAFTPVFASDPIPLPKQIQIVPPDPNLPPEIKALSGKWGGRWWNPKCDASHGFDSVLIIEEIIDERHAIVVYGWGDSKEWDMTKGWTRFNMNISRNEEGKVILSSSSSRGKFEIRVEKDKLEGIFSGYFTNFVTLKRIQ